jgi:maltodextrin utilization protein YvdJ
MELKFNLNLLTFSACCNYLNLTIAKKKNLKSIASNLEQLKFIINCIKLLNLFTITILKDQVFKGQNGLTFLTLILLVLAKGNL